MRLSRGPALAGVVFVLLIPVLLFGPSGQAQTSGVPDVPVRPSTALAISAPAKATAPSIPPPGQPQPELASAPQPAGKVTAPSTSNDSGRPLRRPESAPQPAPAPQPAATGVRRTVSPGDVGAQALARITYPWALLGYRLAIHGPRDGFFGLTDCTSRHIDIYVTPGQTVAQVEFALAFEIAHAVDCTRLSSARQAKWARLRGFHLTGPWFPPCSCSEDAYPSGDFAEVFARWQAGPAYPWRSTLAPAPTARQLQALVPFLQS
jgi:hypothetical protein